MARQRQADRPTPGLASSASCIGLRDLSLIDDEVGHWAYARLPLGFILEGSFVSPLLPLWSLIYHLVLPDPGSPLAVKVFGLVWGVLAVACTYGMAREVDDGNTLSEAMSRRAGSAPARRPGDGRSGALAT